MNSEDSTDQAQFRASLRRYLGDNSRHPSTPQIVSEPMPSGLADLGIYAALLPEADGGFGFGTVDGTVIAEELGRAVAATPFIETSAVAGGLIAGLGSPEQKARWLPGIASGATTIAFVTKLVAADQLDCGMTARRSSDGFACEGDDALVVFGPVSNHLLLIAGAEGGVRSVFIIDRADVALGTPFLTVDGLPAALLSLNGLALRADTRLGAAVDVNSVIAECLDRAEVLQCAELRGLMAMLLNRTLQHLRLRRQFGVALAEFQALQHRLAEMLLAYEQAVSLILRAAAVCDAGASDRRRAVSSCKVQSSRSATLIGNEAIQMHGAIGMTEELIVGPAIKRIRALTVRLGTPHFHLDAYRACNGRTLA